MEILQNIVGSILIALGVIPQMFGAPSTELVFQKTIIPITDSAFDLGTTSKAWRQGWFDTLCLSGDSCINTWPSGGPGGSSAYEIATTSNIAVSGLSYFTKVSGRTTLGSVPTTTATCTGSASCPPFTVIGNSPITISATGGSGSSGLSTTSPISSSNVLVYNSTGAGSAFGAATSSLTANSPLSLSQPISILGSVASALSLDTSGLVPTSRTITVAGTANQVTSSAGAQDLSANRTWTLSLPNHVIFPNSFFATEASTTYATTTKLGVSLIQAIGSGGLDFHSSNGTQVLQLGSGGGSNATFSGGLNVDGATRLATSLTGLLKATTGTISVATAGTDYENPLTFNAPLSRNTNTISLSTTTNSLFTGTAGQVLAFINGGWTGVATTTAGTGLTYTGTAFNVNTSQNITTLSNLTSNGVVYTSGGNGTLNVVASSSLTNGSGLSLSGTLGALLGGSNSTLSVNDRDDIATTTDIAISQLAYISKTGGLTTLGSTPTTTLAAGTNISFSGGVPIILGSSPITINATGGSGSNFPQWATTSPYAGQRVMYPLDQDNTDVVFGKGNGATSSAPFWFDVSATTSYIGNGGFGDSSITFGSSTKFMLGVSSSTDDFRISNSDSLNGNSVLTIAKTTLNAVFSAGLQSFSFLTTHSTTTGSQYFTGITASRPLYVDTTGRLGSAGSGTSGNCIQWGANNTLTDAGSPCGTGSGGSSTEKWATSTDLSSIYPNGGTSIKVGIGTSSPFTSLGIVGTTTASGTIAVLSSSIYSQDKYFKVENPFEKIISESSFACGFGFITGKDSMVGGCDNDGTHWLSSKIGLSSFSWGDDNVTDATRSFAFGNLNITHASHSMTVGTGNTVNTEGSFASGGSNSILNTSSYSQAFGNSNIVGSSTIAYGSAYSFAFGQSNKVVGPWAWAIGNSNIVEERTNQTSADASFAMGDGNEVRLLNSGTIGWFNLVTNFTDVGGNDNIVIGAKNNLSGDGSYIFGRNASSTCNDCITFSAGPLVSPPKLTNTTNRSIMFGVNSTIPTLIITGSGGTGTVGNVGIGTSTPIFGLQIASSTAPQLALSDGSSTSDHWTFRSINNNLFIATSTQFSTSSIPSFSITSGSNFIFQKGNMAIGSSTPTSKRLTVFTSGSFNGANSTIQTTGDGIAVVGGSPGYILRDTGSSNNEATWIWNSTTNQIGTINSARDLGLVTNSIVRLRISDNGIGIGTTTPRYTLHIASSTASQLALSDGSGSTNNWNFRSAGGSLFIATSSASTFATSSVSAISIDADGKVTFGANQATCIALTGSAALCDGSDASGSGGSSSLATSSQETSTYIPFWSSTNGMPALLSGGNSGFTFNDASTLFTVTNASTTNITATYASSTRAVFGSLTVGSLSGFLKATAGVISTSLIDLANDVTGILPISSGGTGWATGFTANTVLIGNGTGRIATTTAGTNGQVLALVGGVPTWTATTTASTGISYNGVSFLIDQAANLVWTGIHDFGSAVLEITNGTAPVIDAVGEIALDTTDNQLLIATSTNAGSPAVIPTMQRLWGATIASTSPDFINGGRIFMPLQRDGFTIKEIHCTVDSGTSVVINISNSGGTTDTETVTCTTSATSDTDITSNPTYASGSLNSLEIGTITGTVDYLTFTVYGVYTRE